MDNLQKTPFSTIYDNFLTRVTSDMYMEFTEQDTFNLLQDLLIAGLSRFEFPRFDIYDYEEGYLDSESTYCGVESNNVEVPAILWVGGTFNAKLTKEEINILSLCMVVEWFGQQLATTENTRMKYTGSDFKMTSQANHMAKLKVMIDSAKTDCIHLQRIYKRREFVDGMARSTAGIIVTTPSFGYNIS